MPTPVYAASAHYLDGKVFIIGGGLGNRFPYKVIQVYHIDDQKWTIISDIPQYYNEAVIMQGHLTLIGGSYTVTGNYTGKLSTYVNDHFWEEIYPPMPTPKGAFGVALEDNLLITAGGMCAGGVLSTVEVLNTESKQWYSLKSLQLPEAIYLCGITISGGYAYIGGGWNAAGKRSKSYWRLPWSAVQQSVQSRDSTSSPVTWEKIADSPFEASSLLPNSKLPILFGGRKSDYKRRSDIFMYDPTQKRWTAVGNISTECSCPCVVPINSNAVFVCGGYRGNNCCTNKTELLTCVTDYQFA